MNDEPTIPCRSSRRDLRHVPAIALAIALALPALVAPVHAQTADAGATAAPAGEAAGSPAETLPKPPADAALAAALAERYALAASRAAVADDPASLRASAAFYDLARAAAPNEARYARAAADVFLRLGEREPAIDALSQLRRIDPSDQLAMIQFVDLTIAGMEAAEQATLYAERVMNARSVAEEVRSHAAMRLVDLHLQRGFDDKAIATLETALTLNPLNVTALETKYRWSVNGARAVDRVNVLARLIEASPADARHIVTLAQECTVAGDYESAAACYRLAFAIVAASGQSPPLDDVVDYVAAELVSGGDVAAAQMLGQAMAAVPNDGRLYSLSLLQAQAGGAAPEALADRVAAARGVYLAQLGAISALVADPQTTQFPATQPAPPMPDVAADVARLRDAGDARMTTSYAIALSELAWFDLYFKAADVDEATLAGLRTLLGEDEPIVVRFEGWRLLNANRLDEARLKFDAVADRDGFAKLGLIFVAHRAGDDARAKRLLEEIYATRPTGLFAAHVAVLGHTLDAKPSTEGVDLDIVNIAMTARSRVADLLDRPRNHYLLTGEILSVSTAFGEPILARLTLLNNGREPITVGPRGYISGTFHVDAQVRGTDPKGFPATVVGQWGGAVRLKPRQSVSQVVRIDEGALGDFIRERPLPLITMSAFATVNSMPGPRGSTFGPGGQQTQIGSVFERRSTPLHVESFRTKLLEQLKGEEPSGRIAAGQLIAASLGSLESAPADAERQAAATQLRDALAAQVDAEADPYVRAWLKAYSATQSGDLADVAATGGEAAAAALTVALNQPEATRRAVAQAAAKASSGDLAALATAIAAIPDAPTPTPESPDAPDARRVP